MSRQIKSILKNAIRTLIIRLEFGQSIVTPDVREDFGKPVKKEGEKNE